MECSKIICEERKLFISSLVNKNNEIKLISKTHRNEIYTKNGSSILKFYKSKTRCIQEILALKNLQIDTIEIPQLIKYDSNGITLHWLEETIVPGKAISDLINIFNYPQIIREIGKIHSRYHKNNIIKNIKEWNALPLEQAYSLNPERIIKLNKQRLEKLIYAEFFPTILVDRIKAILGKYERKILNYNQLVLCHNDFSHRNLLGVLKKENIEILSLIDFELAFPADAISDLSRFILDLLSCGNENLCKQYINGYCDNKEFELEDIEKLFYYTISLCIEILCWSYDNAPEYYIAVFKTLKKLIKTPAKYIELFHV